MFEYKSTKLGNSLLATTNHHLESVFLWDIYYRSVNRSFNEYVPDTPDYYIEMPNHHLLENMGWNNCSLELYISTFSDSKAGKFGLSVYDLNNFILKSKNSSTDSNESSPQYMKSKKVTKSTLLPKSTFRLPLKVSYLSIDNSNNNIIYGTSDLKQFFLDMRYPRKVNYFLNTENQLLRNAWWNTIRTISLFLVVD